MPKPAAPKGKAVATKPAKPAPPKAAKAKPGKPCPKAAAKGNGKPTTTSGSKTEQVLAMLAKGATRKQIVEKTGWQVDLKQFAARKGLILKKDAQGVITAH
jgi:hypothetical protein